VYAQQARARDPLQHGPTIHEACVAEG
jgi:hypothetical protein